jgi:hypothetical protein
MVAGLGVSVLGLHSVLAEMKILQPEEGFPELRSMDVMLYGEEKLQGSIAKAMVGFILRAVHENEPGRPLSQPTTVIWNLPIYPAPFPFARRRFPYVGAAHQYCRCSGPGPSPRDSAKSQWHDHC